jgi:hypothetical protein
MNRYRSYGQTDDPPLIEGDRSLIGSNDWDAPENIGPGQVQAAVNMDFTTQDAVTRGGFVCLPGLGAAPFDSAWVARSTPENSSWNSVAYGNDIFVAVSMDGTNRVMTSPDGFTWTVRLAAAMNSWSSVTFGEGIFVAVSTTGTGNRVMTSPDGITWTIGVSAADSTWTEVRYGAGRFVAVASTGTVRAMYSLDGTTWVSSASLASETWIAAAYGNGLFVAVGTNAVATSNDGITWTSRTCPTGIWTGAAYGENLFVAVGASGTSRAMSSPDGVTWTERTAPGTYTWRAVTFGYDRFVAVASSGLPATNAVMISYNGIDWLLRESVDPVPASPPPWLAVTYGAGLFVAVSDVNFGVPQVMTAYAVTVWASGVYSDPTDPGSQWIMLVGNTSVGFYANGRAPHTISLGSYTVSNQSTIVQCNNLVYLFRGPNAAPIYWDGDWNSTFVAVPTPTPLPGFSNIPNSSQATYYQDRLWVIDGKDEVAASDTLDFNTYDDLANNFNLNKGSSDFLVMTYPFGKNSLLVFKNRSILILENVQGSLGDATVTEITRQVGCIGINSVVSVGPDVVYMSDRNINLITLTATNNSVQHKTLPLSRNISSLLKRVNWDYGYKVSMAYFDNKLFVAVPLDNAVFCDTVLVYNFVTESWFGEWNFASSFSMGIQGWAVANYLGLQRLHAITEDGQILVTGEGQNDISGTNIADIATSLTSRAYNFEGNNATQRRMFVDLGTNRPEFTVTTYTDGASESSTILTDQTYARSESWLFNDSAYDLTNANNDFNRAYRKDYSTGPLAEGSTPGLPSTGLQCGTGFQPEMTQDYRFPIITRRQGRLSWLNITNNTGIIKIRGIGFENHAGQRGSLVQV